MMAGDYLIWSNEHRAWWRADRCGYTVYLKSAGTYSREEAIQICVGSQNGWQSESAPYEIPVRFEDAIECCDRVSALTSGEDAAAILKGLREKNRARVAKCRARQKAEKQKGCG